MNLDKAPFPWFGGKSAAAATMEIEVIRSADGGWRGAVVIAGRERLWTPPHLTMDAASADIWQIADALGWQRQR